MAAGGLSLLALGIYSAKSFTGVTAKYVESRLGKIKLSNVKSFIKIQYFIFYI